MHVTDSRGFFLRVLRRDAGGPLAWTLRGLAVLPAALYALLLRLRRWAYRSGLLRVRRLKAPVISVGNVTVGGTGKTPAVEWLARRLSENGRKPAILSRGYGPHIQSASGNRGRNDEGLLLERRLPDVPLYANPDRVAAGQDALKGGADCLLLDDGFQHLRLHRDLDIVLVDALDAFGGGWVIPAGTLREPPSCLRNADLVVLTRVDLAPANTLDDIRRRLRDLAPGAALVEAVHSPRALVRVDGGETEPPNHLAGQRVYLFCGIGNPQAFLRTAQALEADVVSALYLPDHFGFTRRDVLRVALECERSGAQAALTTEKDAVKIGGAWPGPSPLYALRVEMEFVAGLDRLEDRLKTALRSCK